MPMVFTSSDHIPELEAHVTEGGGLKFKDARTGESIVHIAGVGHDVAEKTAAMFNYATRYHAHEERNPD